MKKINVDLSFLSQPALNPPATTGGASQPVGPCANPLDLVLPVPEPVSAADAAAEPERPSRLVTPAQIQEWNAKVQRLEIEQRTLETSLHWAEAELDHANLENYQRQISALEAAAARLEGHEQKTFVEAHRTERDNLLTSLRLAKADQVEYDRKAALLEPVQAALAQVQSLLMADRLDTEEAAERLARYVRLYGAGQGASV